MFNKMIKNIINAFPKQHYIQVLLNAIDKLLSQKIVNINGHNFVYLNPKTNDKRNLINFIKNIPSNSSYIFVSNQEYLSHIKPILSNLDIIRNYISTTKFENYLARSIIKAGGKNGSNAADDLGDFGEARVVNTFLNKQNQLIWNSFDDSLSLNSYNYDIFKSVLYTDPNIKDAHNNKDQNIKITDISVSTGLAIYKGTPYYSTLLATKRGGGKPKTDESATITFANGKHATFNISVKTPMTSRTKTTVHQGKVQDLLTDLKNTMSANCIFNNSNDFDQLSKALLHFQDNGGFKMNKHGCQITQPDLDYLNNHIADIKGWLINYFCFGLNNHKQHGNQIVNTLTLFNSQNGGVKSLSRKTAHHKLMNQKCNGRNPLSANTPFG